MIRAWSTPSVAAFAASHLAKKGADDPAARLFEYAIFHFDDEPSKFSIDMLDQYLFCLLQLGRPTEILKVAPQQIRLTEASSKLPQELRARAIYALALGRAGLLEAARHESQQTWTRYVAWRGSTDLESTTILVLLAKAEVARMDSRFGDALSAYGDLELYHRANGDVLSVAHAMSEIGMTWDRLGDRERRDSMLTEAANLARSVGAFADAERWTAGDMRVPEAPRERSPSNLLAYVGRLVLVRQGEFDLMRGICMHVIDHARQYNDPELEGMARNMLGVVYEQFGKFAQSRAAMGAAIEVYRRIGDRALEIQVRTNMLRALVLDSRVEDAISYGFDTLRMAQAWRVAGRSAEARQSMGVALSILYGHLVTVCSTRWVADKSEIAMDPPKIDPSPQNLLAIGQASKAVNMVGWLRLSNAAHTAQNPRALATALALRRAETQLERAAAAGANIVHAFDDLEVQRSQLLSNSADVALSVKQQEFSSREIAACLPPNSAVLELLCCAAGVACVLVPASSPPSAILIPWKEVGRASFVRQWLGSMRAERWKVEEEWRSPAGLDDAFQFDGPLPPLSELAIQFQEVFLGPLRRFLAGMSIDHLIVVPQDELYLLPMTLLEDDGTTMSVSVMPSTAAIPLCSSRVYQGIGPRYKIGDATRSLRFADPELALLADYQNIEPSLRLVLESMPLASRLHFAGHGVFENKQPYDSGLIMREPVASNLSTSATARLTIAAVLSEASLACCDLVVLSGCCTGQSRMHKANEFTSLPGAFLVAGAAHVIASLWPAHDGACALLMRELYRELDHNSPGVALARARASLRRVSFDAAVEFLGEKSVPAKAFPFESPIFAHAFQHYGIPEGAHQ